jgi:hypothetical protein
MAEKASYEFVEVKSADILAERQSLWAGFTNATKYAIIAVVALLVLMFLFLV